MLTLIKALTFGAKVARPAALGLLALGATFFQAREARAQWTTSGSTTSTTNNVGVGTAAPSRAVSIESPGAPAVGINTAGVERGTFGVATAPGHWFSGAAADDTALRSQTSDLWIGTYSGAKPIRFVTNDAQRLIIDGAGNVGVGTTSPSFHLHVHNNLNSEVFGTVENSNAGSTAAASILAKTNNGYAYLKMGSTAYGSWGAVGTTGTGSFYYDVFNGAGDHIWRTTASASERMRVTNAGRVGIGTAAPSRALSIESAGAPAVGINTAGVERGTFGVATAPGHWFSGAAADDTALRSQTSDLWIGTYSGAKPIRFVTNDAQRLIIDGAGNVGVGTTSPTSKLHVAGNIQVDGNINAKYQDVAEWVPTKQQLAAGTVVVLDVAELNHVRASGRAYDTGVAGVISAQPGISLGEAGEGKVLVATTGRVKVKVDASRGAIKVGDLLVTSGVEGVAMRSQPLELGGVPIHRPGTIIGKALEPLAGGVGEILVLLSLQ